ncbi:MAG: hypothetical protein V3U10_00015 [Bacteroidota bacterium]
MGKINIGRVVLGGLLAGVVLNIGEFVLNVALLEEQWKAAMESLNLAQVGDAAIVWFNVWGIVMGIAIVWTYAAMRPRFGAGPKTAIIVGLAVWFMLWVLGFGSSIIMGLYPTNLVLISLVWGLFEVPIATVAGAWLYKEQ